MRLVLEQREVVAPWRAWAEGTSAELTLEMRGGVESVKCGSSVEREARIGRRSSLKCSKGYEAAVVRRGEEEEEDDEGDEG